MHNIPAVAFKCTASHTSFVQCRCSNDSEYLMSNEEIEDHFPLNSSEVPTVHHHTAVGRPHISHIPNLDLITVCFCPALYIISWFSFLR